MDPDGSQLTQAACWWTDEAEDYKSGKTEGRTGSCLAELGTGPARRGEPCPRATFGSTTRKARLSNRSTSLKANQILKLSSKL